MAVASGMVVLGPPSPAQASISIINADRSGAGLGPLVENSGLDGLAAQHAQAMAAANTLFHTSNLGSAIGAIIPNWTAVGENVGVGSSLSQVNSMFMSSAEHEANILGAYNYAGLGTFTSADGRVWVVEEFAAVSGAPAPAPAPRVATSTATISQPTSAVLATSTPAVPKVTGILSLGTGYAEIGSDGATFSYGGAPFVGSLAGHPLAAPVVSAAATPSGQGAWLAGADGGVFALGDATYLGGMNGHGLVAPVVGVAANPTGTGYWLASSDGGVFALGQARYAGGLGGRPLAAPVRAIAATPSGQGYWLAAADGGVFAFGDATYFGGMAGHALSAPVVGIAPTSTGRGYWLTAADGGVFAFGDAAYAGGANGTRLGAAIVGMAAAPGGGYRLVGGDGGTFSYGGATFAGSANTLPLVGWRPS